MHAWGSTGRGSRFPRSRRGPHNWRNFGEPHAVVKLGNTDGDVSLAMGIPTVTLGAGNGFATYSLEQK